MSVCHHDRIITSDTPEKKRFTLFHQNLPQVTKSIVVQRYIFIFEKLWNDQFFVHVMLKNEDDLKNEQDLQNKDDLENKDSLKKEDDLKIPQNLKN